VNHTEMPAALIRRVDVGMHRTRAGVSFCISVEAVLAGVVCVQANTSGCKKHDSPQPERQRRRAQQGQRVDLRLLRERGRNGTK
jgi:hypothetical protein